MCKVAIKASHCLVNAVGEPYYYCEYYCGIIIANRSFSFAKATLICSLRPSGKNHRHLGCRNVMRGRGCAVQKKGITLKTTAV